MPTSIYTGSDTDFSDMPSPEQVESWQNDQTKGPVVKEAAAQPKEEAPKEAAPQPEPSVQEEEQKPSRPEAPSNKESDGKPFEGEKKTKYQLAKEKAAEEAKQQE